jgi:hypothetical protein
LPKKRVDDQEKGQGNHNRRHRRQITPQPNGDIVARQDYYHSETKRYDNKGHNRFIG